MTAGLIALKMGRPIAGLCAATNENDILQRFIETGEFKVSAMVRY